MGDDLFSQRTCASLGETNRQCTATSKHSGERCRRSAIRGGFVCAHHGGSAPQTIAAARQRLLEAAVPAAGVLARAVEQHGPRCAHCGRSDDDRDPVALRAAQLVLDRVGLHAAVTVQVERPAAEPPAYMDWMPAERMRELLREMTTLHREAQAAMERGDAPPDFAMRVLPSAKDDAIDVDVIEIPTTDEPDAISASPEPTPGAPLESAAEPQGVIPPGN